MNWPPDNCEVPTTRRGKFPGLQAGDAAVLRHALDNGTIRPDRMWLNVPVGNPPHWSLDPRLAPFAYRLRTIYQRRIDLVIQQDDQLTAIELKPLGSPTALGQALVYRELANLDAGDAVDVSAAILCDVLQPDIAPIARQAGVRILETTSPPARAHAHAPPVPQRPESENGLARPGTPAQRR